MKKRKLYTALFLGLTAAALVLLCLLLWNISDAARSDHTGTDFPVYISEILPGNTLFPDENGEYPDFIELHNRGTYAIDLGGFQLGDGSKNARYKIPKGTVLEPDGYLVVSCQKNGKNAEYADFGISRMGGETLYFLTAKGVVIERITTWEIPQDMTLVSDGAGNWSVSPFVTPGMPNTEESYLALWGGEPEELPAVFITEVMPGNKAVLPCENGEFCDWIELYNGGKEDVNLVGWFLSDNPEKPAKWIFPDFVLAPGEYRVLFCSGTDAGRDHTAFSLSASGETLTLTSPGGTTSQAVTFGEIPADSSLCIDPASGETGITAMVTPGFANDEAGYTAYRQSLSPRGKLAIWELQTANDRYLPQALGKCYDWVELKNISEEELALSDYCLTDDSAHRELAPLPEIRLAPGEMTVLILSGDVSLSGSSYTHLPFSLSAKGDRLYLYDKAGSLADFVLIGEIPYGMSLGRTDGGFAYMTPTPMEENGEGVTEVSPALLSNASPGAVLWSAGEAVTLTGEGTIYYTTDGSIPTAESAVYTEPISVTESTVLRALPVAEGKLPGPVYTASLLVAEEPTLPICSIVTDPQSLWGKDGLYRYTEETKGQYYPANLSYSGPEGTFSLDCDLTMHGHSSLLAQEKKSFEVRFRSYYDGNLEFDLFGDPAHTSFRSLILRADQEGSVPSFLRDNMMSRLAAENCPSLISQNYRYVALYLNGEYWGLYSIREHHSAYHYAVHQNVPVDAVTVTKHYIDKNTTLGAVQQFCRNHSLASEENYRYVADTIDISSFIDWIILESYVGNPDINGNVRYYYDSVKGLWKCGLVDLDLGMFHTTTFAAVTDCNSHNIIPNALLQNGEFREALLIRLAELLGGDLSDEAMLSRIHAMAGEIREEMPAEAARWGYAVSAWERNIRELESYCTGRAGKMVSGICQLLHLSGAEREAYFGGLSL